MYWHTRTAKQYNFCQRQAGNNNIMLLLMSSTTTIKVRHFNSSAMARIVNRYCEVIVCVLITVLARFGRLLLHP